MIEKRTPGIESAAKILPKSIHALGPAVEHLFYCHSVLFHWPQIVGEAIAANVEAVRIVKKTLWLYSYDATWRTQIQMMQLEILQRVNNFAGQSLVQELRFARSGKERAVLRDELMDTLDYRTLLPKVNLTAEELAAVKAQVADVEDDALRDHLFRLSLKQAKLQHLWQSLGYHPCEDCGVLCEPEKTRCSICEAKHHEATRAAVRRYLEDIPWARFGEVLQEIPEATPEMLASVRASYVQQLASETLLEAPDTMTAKTLTMAFRCVPPEQLTEDLVRRTLYRLRHDLAKPKEWKPVKRYEYISWGKKKEKKG